MQIFIHDKMVNWMHEELGHKPEAKWPLKRNNNKRQLTDLNKINLKCTLERTKWRIVLFSNISSLYKLNNLFGWWNFKET